MKYGLIRKGPGKNSKILIYTVSLFAIILWGISYIWTNTLISLDIPVTYFVFVRILLAGFVLFLLNAASGRIAKIKKKDIPKFLLLAFFEPFIYHPFIVFFSIRGYFNYIINKRAVWGEMTRKGFSGKKSEVKPNTAESSGVGGVS